MTNIIDIHRRGTTLEVVLDRGFSIWIRRIVEHHIHPAVNKLQVDMSRSHRIDSEGVIFLFRWQRSGKQLELINPPRIFFEIVRILELDEVWDLSSVVNTR